MDFCIGAFSHVPKRANWTAFSPDMYHALFYLISQHRADSFWDIATRVFAPFSAELWITIIAATLVMSAVMTFHEYPVRHEDGDSDFGGSNSFWKSTVKSVYVGVQAFIAGDCEHNAATVPGKFANLGLGLLMMFVLAAYTANMVSMLLKQNGAQITSITEAISLKAEICCQVCSRGGAGYCTPPPPGGGGGRVQRLFV